MNISEVRELFPYLKSGKIYFNHASTGPLSTRVLSSINSHLTLQSETKIDDYLKLIKTVEETKAMLGRMLNSSPDRIAFLDNTTNGINILARGIKWQKGDRIILNDIEFPANVYPFLNLQNEEIEIDFVKSHAGRVTAEDIIDVIKPETKLISISFVQFLSGYKADLEKIGNICREKEIIFCVDAIQGLGAIRLDVEKDKIDFLSSGTQKWMLGLQGFAFIYVRKELQDKMHPIYAGWLGVENAWNLLDYKLKFKKGADAFQTGTINTLGIYALNASLKLFTEFGFDEVEKRVLTNSEYLINQLQKIGIQSFLAGCKKENLSGIVSFEHNDVQKYFKAFDEKNITVAVREGVLRISPHFYNTEEEIEQLITMLKNLI